MSRTGAGRGEDIFLQVDCRTFLQAVEQRSHYTVLRLYKGLQFFCLYVFLSLSLSLPADPVMGGWVPVARKRLLPAPSACLGGLLTVKRT